MIQEEYRRATRCFCLVGVALLGTIACDGSKPEPRSDDRVAEGSETPKVIDASEPAKVIASPEKCVPSPSFGTGELPGSYYSIDTKGTPLSGTIGSRDGSVIGTTQLFGERTDTIHMDSNQAVVLRDENGDVIAGFEISAIDPAVKKVTQLYEYWREEPEEDGKHRGVLLEHKVSKTEFRGGVLSTEGAERVVLTSRRAADDTQLTVTFEEIGQYRDNEGRCRDVVIFSSPEGNKFEFYIEASSSMRHTLSYRGGDIISFLDRKAQEAVRDE
jgi:hypothetical protein